MRVHAAPLALLACLVLAAGAPAGAEDGLLSAEEIVRVLPGDWELDPDQATGEQRGDFRCSARPQMIRITETDAGLVYESRLGDAPEARVRRSAVRLADNAILLRYEDEDRLTPAGEPVEWLLFMPDADHFFWVRRDWLESGRLGRTALRRRCVQGPVA